MKSLHRLLISSAIVAAFALAAFAQTTPPAATPAAPATQCDEQTNIRLYEEWRNKRTGDAEAQKVAYASGREYLEKCTGTADAAYINAVKKWIDRYEKVTRDFEFDQAVTKSDYATAYRVGRDLIAADAQRLQPAIILGWMGYLASVANNDAYVNDAANYARRALAAIESGQQPTGPDGQVSWRLFGNREDALGGLNFALGHFAMKGKRPEEAATYFHKAAQVGGFTKTEPSTYANLAAAYAANGEYRRLIQEYENLVKANADAAGTEQAKTILARVDPHTDRIIDAYARAVALATDPKLTTQKADWMKRLTDFYKFRNNNSDAGLTEFIAGINAKPMPAVVTTLPPAPAPVPATTTGTAPATTGNTPATTGSVPATTSSTPPKP